MRAEIKTSIEITPETGQERQILDRDVMVWALKQVVEERGRQIAKHGTHNGGALRWLVILAEEFGEVAHEVEEIAGQPDHTEEELEGKLQRLEEELIQVAAVAVAWLEQLQRIES